MNITRENVNDQEIQIRIDIELNDYAEELTKLLKKYRKDATLPGFRPGKVPQSVIDRRYKTPAKAELVERTLGEKLDNYIREEKIDLIGYPLTNTEKTGEVDFEQDNFSFYFDAALMPQITLDWSKITEKLTRVAVTDADVDEQVKDMCQRAGKFETPEVIGEDDYVYGKVEEIDAEGKVVEGGVNTFCSFDLHECSDDETRKAFAGKKKDDVVRFEPAKAFAPEKVKTMLRLADDANFNGILNLTVSGCSHMTPHEINEELFKQIYPDQTIASEEDFRKVVREDIQKEMDRQSQILFVNGVHKSLVDNFDATLPEAFLKRWMVASSRENEYTPERVEEEWNDQILPSIKWEVIENAIEKGQASSIQPQREEVEAEASRLVEMYSPRQAEETDDDHKARVATGVQGLLQDRESFKRIFDRVYEGKLTKCFLDAVKPATEDITREEFAERCKR